MKLYAARYTNNDTTSTLIEPLKSVSDLGIRWSIPGGLQRLEFNITVRNKYDLFQRMNFHAGQRVVIYSPRMSKPIAGWIYEVNSMGAGIVQYVCMGAWRRLKDVFDVTTYDPTNTSGAVVGIALADHCLFYNGSGANIASTGAAIGGWQVAEEIGNTVQDIIQDMIDMSDSTYRQYDFWMVDEALNGTTLRQMIPYFQPRSSTNPITWQVDIAELGGLDTGMGINETFSHFTIFYDTLGGVATGGNATTLTDSAASFLTDGLTEGDRVANEDDNSLARIVTIDSNTQLTISALSGGTADVFASGDAYSITRQNLQSVVVSGTPINDMWVKYWREIKRGFDVTQANNYANMLLERKNAYKQQSPFTINSETIRDISGARWPLPEMIARGGGYLRINDTNPSSSVFTDSMNNSSTFFITSLDYDNTSGQMRVVVDNPDRRLDVRLLAAGILNGEMVSRK